jgi:quercetin dioxygenase-like cupin family protein
MAQLDERHIAALRRHVRAAFVAGGLDAGTCARFGAILDRLRPARPPGGGDALPVMRWWNRAQAGTPRSSRALLAALGPLLVWTRNPNYRRRPDPRFLGNYGYGVVLGPTGRLARPLIPDPAAALGLLVLGPGLEYRRHRHPAEEIYIPLAGTAWWQRGDEPWRRVAPGTAIHHPPGLPHATRTGGEPLVALYIWQGEIGIHARLDG